MNYLLLFFLIPALGLGTSHVDVAVFDGIISPVASRFIKKAIAEATEDGAEVLVIQLDTPGGLDTSMRDIVKEILNAKIPICVFVAPAGARAASAGVFITLAAHISAMAPSTSIGAAHPVSIGKEKMDEKMIEKVTNDAAAYIRSIAKKRGKNVKWAEQAVRKSISATNEEAVKKNIVDLTCKNIQELLEKLDGREVKLEDKKVVIKTKNVEVKKIEMGLKDRILSVITDPNIAYILLLLGMYGLIFELQNPGAIFPGVVGSICLILAFFAFQMLPVNFAALLLIILAIILFILETQITSHGLLTIGGIIAITFGSIMLMNTDVPFLKISWKVILPAVVITAALFIFAIGMGIRVQFKKPTTGKEGLIGEIAVARTKIDKEGKVFVNGEIWGAESKEVIKKGEKVKIVGFDKLTLKVEKI